MQISVFVLSSLRSFTGPHHFAHQVCRLRVADAVTLTSLGNVSFRLLGFQAQSLQDTH